MTFDEKWHYIQHVIAGPMSISDIEILIPYAKKIPKNGTIVDIGTCEGKSALTLALYSDPSVKIITIDPIPRPEVARHIEALDFNDKVTFIPEKSQDCGKKWKQEIDMFFNDGLHEYGGVKEDIEVWCPWVKPDGYCIFHDFTLYNNTVGKAISEGEGKYYKLEDVIGNFYVGRKYGTLSTSSS